MAPETPRAVSSRLLTMKFMQRAVASENSSPDSETHSSKKRKTGHSPAAGRLDLNIDQAAIKAALDAQETKRQEALEKHVGADTHWVLDNPFAGLKAASQTKAPLNVVYVGYGDMDSSNDSGDNEDVPRNGRTSTNSFKKAANQACRSLPYAKQESQKTSDNDSDSEYEDSDDTNTPAHGQKRKPSSDSPSRSRSRSRSRPTAESAKAKEFRDKRKKKEVKLSKPTSISSGGGISSGGSQFSPAGKAMTCYKCHQTGHKAVGCPKRGQMAHIYD
ncbi:uncharacterized protein FFUJ_02957 [Fusarium fujikuroi IMI 58289]|uniref:CCHC-type domain-containing protein n=2 Tax=Fusarium fujikuroi TaxID=5127 RepID=S0DU32_GIBF5|nr:uncharacterized protein FFUJ_02957 [Fusarium fujikuroi IMI 58289]QGI62150.1 hypothetical protein CEK27_006121 [Fusarium fujikuroi]QGI79320.1 hypothetical protein CEK25_006049 [Fusarium fujikuroi]QGI93046.1 hypothetical protein CEK26_006115 [Fusarium fujikuroi]CCT65965.1 uncharacterized protein FFUJ_02957 [Fusarium fujikuroi IMI 58289]VTT57132.1 unnamed protein product [Fusarium fujikuroi]